MIYSRLKYRTMGDRALLVEVGDEIHTAVNEAVRGLFITLEEHPIGGVIDAVPTYRSLLIIYNPLAISLTTLRAEMAGLWERVKARDLPEPESFDIPVCYGGRSGPDLEWVARYAGMSPEAVIRLHTGTRYRVFMIGFTPGHPYMAELPEALFTPRRETPRSQVPLGSVGIGTKQTVIYPFESPGGMHILGRTPWALFDPNRSPPTLLNMGDWVRFFPIQEEETSYWKRRHPWKL
jgi:KipI family sensor histidine kinase inhibitor